MENKLINKNNFKFFFQEYFEPIFQFARRYTEENEIAKDIAQNTFIKLYERWSDFDVFEQAKSFAYITARNLCLNYIKHKKIEQEFISTYLLNEEAEQQFFTEEMAYQEILRKLQKAIDKLSPQSRNIIRISLEGKTNNEIAAQLNISVNTVKTLKKNAYKYLYDALDATF